MDKIERTAKILREFGFSGACIVLREINELEKVREKIQDLKDFKFMVGLELCEERIELMKEIKKFDYSVFRDPSYKTARMLVDKKKVNCIYFKNKFIIDDVFIKKLSESGVAIEFCFGDILNSNRIKRSIILKKMMLIAKMCEKYNANCLLTSGAENVFGLRNRNSLENFGRIIGFSKTKKFFSLPNREKND
jgi:RNase P/RNase MRP subunit p30